MSGKGQALDPAYTPRRAVLEGARLSDVVILSEVGPCCLVLRPTPSAECTTYGVKVKTFPESGQPVTVTVSYFLLTMPYEHSYKSLQLPGRLLGPHNSS